MRISSLKWSTDELAKAMQSAILGHANSRFLKVSGNKIFFNGFWRDGNKQNVCAWLDSATWHDAKTGEGGGCKDFAQTAFNLTLPEFMERYSYETSPKETFSFPKQGQKSANALADYQIDEIWKKLCSRDLTRENHAKLWLENVRGLTSPDTYIGSGFASLYETDLNIFDSSHYGFLKNRLSRGPQLIAPIRGVNSNNVVNLFFRSITNVSKEYKSRLLPNSGGWGCDEREPRAFGFPKLIKDFPLIILCEGMADYFATECLLGQSSNCLALGVPSASSFPKWATFLSNVDFQGNLVILYQLDTNIEGVVSSKAIGQTRSLEALKILLNNKQRAALFDWPHFLKETKPTKIPGDIADIFLVTENLEYLSSAFEECLKRTIGYGYL